MTGGAISIAGGAAARLRPWGAEAEFTPVDALFPTSRRGGTVDDMRGAGGNWSLGMAGSSFFGGGAGLGGGGAGLKAGPVVGVSASSGVRELADLL